MVLQLLALSPPVLPEDKKSVKYALKVDVGFGLAIKLIIHAPRCCNSPVRWANKRQAWFVFLRASKCRALPATQTHTHISTVHDI